MSSEDEDAMRGMFGMVSDDSEDEPATPTVPPAASLPEPEPEPQQQETVDTGALPGSTGALPLFHRALPLVS